MPPSYEFVSQLPLLDTLQPTEERLLQGKSCRKRIGQRLQLVTAGMPADFLGIVLTGRVGEYVSRAGGGEFLMRILGPGDSFGNLESGVNGSAQTSVLALEDGEVLCISSRVIEELASRNSKFREALQADRHRRLSRMVRHMQLLTADGSRERIMGFLSLIAGDFALKDREGRHIPLPISHQTIADSCGLTRETVSRKFGVLAETGQVLRTDLGWVLPGP